MDLKFGDCISQRQVFGKTLVELGKEYPNLLVLDPDVGPSTQTHFFKAAYPDRFFEIGIAEQNMMGIAAGLAASGAGVAVTTTSLTSPSTTTVWTMVSGAGAAAGWQAAKTMLATISSAATANNLERILSPPIRDGYELLVSLALAFNWTSFSRSITSLENYTRWQATK